MILSIALTGFTIVFSTLTKIFALLCFELPIRFFFCRVYSKEKNEIFIFPKIGNNIKAIWKLKKIKKNRTITLDISRKGNM